MKKVLSLLLTLVLLLGVAAPVAHAAGAIKAYEATESEATKTVSIDGKPKELTIYLRGDEVSEPVTIYKDDIVIIILDNPELAVEPDPDDPDDEGTPAGTYDWTLRDELYVVSLRVLELDGSDIVDYEQDKVSNLKRTYGAQMLAIVGAAPGNNQLIVQQVVFGPDGKFQSYQSVGTLDINVQEKPQEPGGGLADQPDLWFILKMYCTELKWFWEYNVHNTLKAIYFAVRDWFYELGDTIKGWFSCEDEVVVPLDDEEEVPPPAGEGEGEVIP